jgi:two-component system cell cycle response regulator
MEKDGIDYSRESVLVVDDDTQFRETLVQLLSVLGFETGSASSGPGALTKLKENEYTFLLADMKMPDMDGLKLIEQAGKDFPDMSIIAMTGYAEGYRYIDVINAGASDFIKKPFESEELEAKVNRIIGERNLRKELSRLSITDSLTGLFNQRHFYSRLKEEITRAQRQSHSLALILLDLDHFKAYNDTYGHLAGDEVLRNLGRIINKNIREGVDSGYRYGGDEFAVILIDADLSVASEIGKRIQNALLQGNFTASVGYATFVDGMTEKELVSEADKNLYKAKLKIKSKMASG